MFFLAFIVETDLSQTESKPVSSPYFTIAINENGLLVLLY